MGPIKNPCAGASRCEEEGGAGEAGEEKKGHRDVRNRGRGEEGGRSRERERKRGGKRRKIYPEGEEGCSLTPLLFFAASRDTLSRDCCRSPGPIRPARE